MTSGTQAAPYSILRLERTRSTNDYARQLLETDEFRDKSFAVTAEFQESGKGQRGNSWESEESRNLLLSVVLHPLHIQAKNQFLLSEIIALSAVETYDRYLEGCSVKWPNDIYYHDQKLAGILIENALQGNLIQTAICGIGCNINQSVFRSDAPNPVSPFQILGHEISRDEFLHCFLGLVYEKMLATEAHYDESQEKIHRAFRQRLWRKEGFHTFKDADGLFKARIVDVKPEGPLCLEDEQGNLRSYLFKEVQYIL